VSTASLVKSVSQSCNNNLSLNNKFSLLAVEEIAACDVEECQGASVMNKLQDKSSPSSVSQKSKIPISNDDISISQFPTTVNLPTSVFDDPVKTHKAKNQMDLDVIIETLDTGKVISTMALLDSGCSSSCIDRKFVAEHGINVTNLSRGIPVTNADGSSNAIGAITQHVILRMKIGKHEELRSFFVSDLGKSSLFIGLYWLRDHNPNIDWKHGRVFFTRCPADCQESKPKPVNIRNVAIPEQYQEFHRVFEKESFDQLPPHRPWDHAIDLLPDCNGIEGKIYPLPPERKRELDKFLDENLAAGKIRPSKSPYASPIFFVKKKETGSLRPVQDYRKLNDSTIKNRYPLPLISELIDQLAGAKYFTKLDVRWGFNNVRIKEGDEAKAAFLTHRGLFEPLVMQFGLCNAPATFQTMMNGILRIEIINGKIVVYVDDILIFSTDLKSHREAVKQVLSKLQDNHLYLKPEKCEFEQSKVTFLGMVISENSVAMDESKVTATKEWPVPTNKRSLQQFLGFTNYYRRFIKDFGMIARPLHKLTGNTIWEWTDEQNQAFLELKHRISTAPTLAIPNDKGKFKVECDASNFALGGVLSQQQADGKWHPVDFMSVGMSPAERNYEIYDKELLAVMTALEKWRKYLLGTKEKFEIWSDHLNLTYYRKPQKLTRRQARWVAELQEYDFTMHHIPGKANNKADILSRRAGHDQGEGDNEDVVVLTPEMFHKALFLTDAQDEDILKRIQQSSGQKEKSILGHIINKDPFWLETEEGLIMWKNRIYVPKDSGLREQIIQLHHDPPVIGHPGTKRTEELIMRNYWWPYISKDVKLYVLGCDTCQRTKPNRHKLAAPLHPHATPSQPWEEISWDMIGPLPMSSGHDAILVIVDRFTKRIILEAVNMELTAEGAAHILRDRVFRDHGIPRKVISDRGSQFVSKFMKAFYHLVGIEANPSTAYHPQTGGQTERMNQEIEQYLRIFVDHRQSDWAEWLSLAEFAHNDKIHSATGYSPFFLDYGQHPWKGIEPRRTTRNENAQAFADRMRRIRQDAISSLNRAADTMKRYYDKKKGKAVEYKHGDLVWLDSANVTTFRPSKKLDDKRLGPFPIVKVCGNGHYKLKLPRHWHMHPVFNESILLPFHPPQFQSQKGELPPPPEIVNGEEEYKVEKILDSRLSRGKLQYLIKWEGYPKEENMWVPEQDASHAQYLIDEFYQTHPSAPRRITVPIHFISLENFTEVMPVKESWWNGKLVGKEKDTGHVDMTLKGG
jgi:transposase InsO family protein